MSCDMPPELRSYLDGVLDAALAQLGMTIHNQHTRQRVLWKLLKARDSFVFLRIRAALPPTELTRLNGPLEQGVTEEELQAITTRSIPNVQAFAQGIFVDFRAYYVNQANRSHDQHTDQFPRSVLQAERVCAITNLFVYGPSHGCL